MDPELTLEKAKKAIQQKEAVKGHQSVLNTDQLQTSNPIDAIKSTTLPQRRFKACTRCRKGPHGRDKCPT